MKKHNRILRNAEFSALMRTGKKFHTASLCFYYRVNTNQLFRIGITVSKKVSKLAVARNLIKRRITAILTELYDINKLYDIIIIVKSGTDTQYDVLKTQIEQFIKKI